MCGIVGLFLKNPDLEPQLGELLSRMLSTMCERGPDSAGFAVYGSAEDGRIKITLQSATARESFAALKATLAKDKTLDAKLSVNDTHALLSIPSDKLDAVKAILASDFPSIRTMATGENIEIYKEVGNPNDVAKRFDLAHMSGTHAIGHTRMATESAVTTLGAHPFSTGADECLVHNGSLSNHASLRRELVRDGMTFNTENDTEVAASYLTWRMKQGMNLGEALEKSLDDLDGFFNFVVGTKSGFGVVRDPIACKPAVMAETDDYVAFGSEYRALAGLPGIDTAKVWEPEPATVYFWQR
ncbi:MAG: glutamine amidotransferase family protein [Hyphomicrobium sp.]